MMAVAAWVSPVTTAAAIGLMAALLGLLVGREVWRQRYAEGRRPRSRRVGAHGPVRQSHLGRRVGLLGAVLIADVLLRFGILAHGH